jgi:hypothetical protein
MLLQLDRLIEIRPGQISCGKCHRYSTSFYWNSETGDSERYRDLIAWTQQGNKRPIFEGERWGAKPWMKLAFKFEWGTRIVT